MPINIPDHYFKPICVDTVPKITVLFFSSESVNRTDLGHWLPIENGMGHWSLGGASKRRPRIPDGCIFGGSRSQIFCSCRRAVVDACRMALNLIRCTHCYLLTFLSLSSLHTACGHRMADRKWKKVSNSQACCLAQLCLAAA